MEREERESCTRRKNGKIKEMKVTGRYIKEGETKEKNTERRLNNETQGSLYTTPTSSSQDVL